MRNMASTVFAFLQMANTGDFSLFRVSLRLSNPDYA